VRDAMSVAGTPCPGQQQSGGGGGAVAANEPARANRNGRR
jgi:hypothetical protein